MVLNLVTIGLSGHGKSSFLNALVAKGVPEDEEVPFAVAASSDAVTKEITKRNFVMSHGDTNFEMSLTDTMGFQDPVTSRRCYDAMVAECNKEQHVIVWVHKASRENHGLVEQIKMLLQECKNANPLIILVMNGCEAYARMPAEKQKEKKKKHRRTHKQIGVELVQKAGIHVNHIIAGADMDDLHGLVQEQLMDLLVECTRSRSSEMKYELVNVMEPSETAVEKVIKLDCMQVALPLVILPVQIPFHVMEGDEKAVEKIEIQVTYNVTYRVQS